MNEYIRTDLRSRKLLKRIDHRKIIGFICDQKLIAKAKDLRSKLIFDYRY